MEKKFLIAATVFAASLPALAGTVMENTVAPSHKLAANQAQAQMPAPRPIDATGKQAKAVSHDTNRKIARGEIKPQRDPAHEEAPGQ